MPTATLRIHDIGNFHPEITTVLGKPSEAHIRGDPAATKFPYLKETAWINDIWMKEPTVDNKATFDEQIGTICELLLSHAPFIERLLLSGAHLDVYCPLAGDVKDYSTIKASRLRVLSDFSVDLTFSVLPTTLHPEGYPGGGK